MDTQTPDQVVAQWYEAEGGALRRYVRSLVRDPEQAEDICQEAFMRLLVVARAGRLPDAPGAWVHRVAHNLVVSEARRRRTGERALERLADEDVSRSTEESIVARERDRHLVAALTEAPSDDRRAMLLAAQGFRSREIGEQLGRTEPAARTLLCRARGRLRARLLAFEPA
jgi:RNA polymerase sigma-70 factor (ECF subfamily)